MDDGAWTDPQIPARERTAYRGTISGERQGEGALIVVPHDEHYEVAMEATVAGHLRYVLDGRFERRRGLVLADSYRLQTLDGERAVAVEEGRFRDVQVLDWGGALGRYPRSTTPLLMCAVALRGMEFDSGARRSFRIWLANTATWDIALHVERRETVTLPCGRHDAWRVRARPSFEQVARTLDKVVGALLPPFVLHFDAQPPHRLLRFSFPTGPFPWNPRALIEAEELG